jgi:hypothetical protein
MQGANRMVAGAVGALLLTAAGVFWWQGRAEMEKGAPPPDPAGPSSQAPIELPSADAHGRGDALPTVTKKQISPEERRFNRYDRNRDGRISRPEMLSTRVKAFQKLDINHDNLLSFEEWAVKTSDRFAEIDTNHDGIISHEELNAYYAQKDKEKAERAKAKAASCPCAAPAAKGAKPAGKGPHPKPADDDDDDS